MRDSSITTTDCADFDGPSIRTASIISITVGVAVLVGWVFDVAVLKSVVPGWATMKANAAISFMLFGALLFTNRGPGLVRHLIYWISVFALTTICIATLCEHVFNINLGIDELFFCEKMEQPTRFFQPGRMSPLAAVSFLLFMAAVLQRVTEKWHRWIQQFCLVAPLLVSARTLVGLLYGVPAICQHGKWGPMAFHMAISLMAVSAVLLLSRRQCGLASFFSTTEVASNMARSIVPWAIGAPFIVGLICVYAEKEGLFESRYAVTVFVVMTAFALVAVLVQPLRLISQLDQRQRSATQTAERYRLKSEIDGLTGILNRRGFVARAEEELKKTRANGSCLSCLVLDIDFFKKINDVHGHHAGDNVLRQFATILKETCRVSDVIGRIGGEEFCVLLPETDEHQAMALANRFRRRMANEPFFVNGANLQIASSGGISQLASTHAGLEAVIEAADAALLIAKRTGRNRVLLASSLDKADWNGATPRSLLSAPAHAIMQPAIAVIACDTSVEAAARQLLDLNVESLPLVDRDGKLLGLITEQDVVDAMLDQGHAKPVATCQHAHVATFEESTSADEIAAFFARTSIQRVLIVQQDVPVGVISRRTLLRWLMNQSSSRHLLPDGGGLRSEADRCDETACAIHELSDSVSRLAKIWKSVELEEFRPGLVGEATRIQESVDVLLRNARVLTVTGPPDTAVGAMALG